MPVQEKINVSNLTIVGENIEYSNVESIIEHEPIVIFHFLRHLGCTFCHESVIKFRLFLEKNPNFPKIIFVHQGNLERGHDFFEKMLPGALHIADEAKEIYERFGILKMKTSSFFNPLLWAQIFKQKLQGLGTGIHTGDDVLLLSGTFLFYNGELTWVHRAETAGDEPNLKNIKIAK